MPNKPNLLSRLKQSTHVSKHQDTTKSFEKKATQKTQKNERTKAKIAKKKAKRVRSKKKAMASKKR